MPFQTSHLLLPGFGVSLTTSSRVPKAKRYNSTVPKLSIRRAVRVVGVEGTKPLGGRISIVSFYVPVWPMIYGCLYLQPTQLTRAEEGNNGNNNTTDCRQQLCDLMIHPTTTTNSSVILVVVRRTTDVRCSTTVVVVQTVVQYRQYNSTTTVTVVQTEGSSIIVPLIPRTWLNTHEWMYPFTPTTTDTQTVLYVFVAVAHSPSTSCFV